MNKEHSLRVAGIVKFYLLALLLLLLLLEEQYRSKLGMANRSLEEEKERLKRREAEIEESLYSQRQAGIVENKRNGIKETN